ncbi:RWD-domain-containing protein [Panus rudis PR-1116 ss-1]|nr:RWD-domain-containing protein [Panus rudis PR-1116 ss-1]
MSADVLLEEFEVLESIYPTELTKLSEREIRIDVEPEDITEGEEEVKLALNVHYVDDYPDALPDLSLEAIEGDIDDEERTDLLNGLKAVVRAIFVALQGEENLGMAMTFTLVTHLREQLLKLVQSRMERRQKEAMEKERLAIEAEEARTRGTPVTPETFKAWKVKFDKEMAEKRAKEEEEKLKAMSPKEREEYKKLATRLSGRQLFERDKNLAVSDDTLIEEGAVSVDVSQYDRTTREEEEEDNGVTFSDSD